MRGGFEAEFNNRNKPLLLLQGESIAYKQLRGMRKCAGKAPVAAERTWVQTVPTPSDPVKPFSVTEDGYRNSCQRGFK